MRQSNHSWNTTYKPLTFANRLVVFPSQTLGKNSTAFLVRSVLIKEGFFFVVFFFPEEFQNIRYAASLPPSPSGLAPGWVPTGQIPNLTLEEDTAKGSLRKNPRESDGSLPSTHLCLPPSHTPGGPRVHSGLSWDLRDWGNGAFQGTFLLILIPYRVTRIQNWKVLCVNACLVK